MSNLLIGAVMTILILLMIGLMVGYSRLIERHAARRPKSDAAKTPPTTAPPQASSPIPAWPSLVDAIMSKAFGTVGALEGDASSLDNDSTEGLQPLAMPSKPANDALARQELDARSANDLQDITPVEARAIIRQQAYAEAVVRILKAAEAGKVKSAADQAGLIEAVAGGSRTSRLGTPYMGLKTIVDELRNKPKYRDYPSELTKFAAAANAHEE